VIEYSTGCVTQGLARALTLTTGAEAGAGTRIGRVLAEFLDQKCCRPWASRGGSACSFEENSKANGVDRLLPGPEHVTRACGFLFCATP